MAEIKSDFRISCQGLKMCYRDLSPLPTSVFSMVLHSQGLPSQWQNTANSSRVWFPELQNHWKRGQFSFSSYRKCPQIVPHWFTCPSLDQWLWMEGCNAFVSQTWPYAPLTHELEMEKENDSPELSLLLLLEGGKKASWHEKESRWIFASWNTRWKGQCIKNFW